MPTINLTTEQFKKDVFDYTAEKEWKFVIYKVDTEAEQELSAAFGIQSIPSILFIPSEGQPMMSRGAMPKHQLKKVIEEELLKAES